MSLDRAIETRVVFSDSSMDPEYGQDGYGHQRAWLILETGETVAVASVTTAAELQALKAILGRRPT